MLWEHRSSFGRDMLSDVGVGYGFGLSNLARTVREMNLADLEDGRGAEEHAEWVLELLALAAEKDAVNATLIAMGAGNSDFDFARGRYRMLSYGFPTGFLSGLVHLENANSVVTRCDVLASDPYDAGRRAPGRLVADVASEAEAACSAAHQADPTEPRATFQLARAMSRLTNRSPQFMPLAVQAAESGVAAAFVLIAETLEEKKDDRSEQAYAAAAQRALIESFPVLYPFLESRAADDDDRKGLAWYAEKAAALGVPEAHLALAGLSDDPVARQVHLALAARIWTESGNPAAANMALGQAVADLGGVQVEEVEARVAELEAGEPDPAAGGCRRTCEGSLPLRVKPPGGAGRLSAGQVGRNCRRRFLRPSGSRPLFGASVISLGRIEAAHVLRMTGTCLRAAGAFVRNLTTRSGGLSHIGVVGSERDFRFRHLPVYQLPPCSDHGGFFLRATWGSFLSLWRDALPPGDAITKVSCYALPCANVCTKPCSSESRFMNQGAQAAHRWAGRVEDLRLITGEGRFSDDLRLPDQVFAVFVRSPHAHARIVGIEIAEARAAPGVVAVLTAADMDRAGVGNVSVPPPLTGRGGRKLVVPHRPALARDRVMHVGDAVALVIAESAAAAHDAAELVAVDYDELPAVTEAEVALRPGAPVLWPEAPGNVAVDWVAHEAHDAAVARLLAEAPHRVRVTAVNQRLAGVPLEPRAATAAFDPATGRYTLHAGSQGAGALRAQLAQVMGVEPGKIRVLTEDVGGAFGLKTPAYPEYPALMAAAKMLGRPVHWAASRSESFVSDNQGRDTVATAELALDAEGRFLALKVDTVANMGAYLSSGGANIATSNFSRCFSTVYRIPAISIGVVCAFTNTVPTGPYRGAGRPEANYVMERLVDAAARQTGLDPIAIRRRNLIRPEAMPYTTPLGATIDSGEFETILDKALAAANHATFEERRASAAAHGKLRGLGISMFLEHAGAMGTESADLSFPGQGRLTLGLGVQSSGQGHATVFRDLLADRLGVHADTITVREGDSDFGLKGMASVASRSAMTVERRGQPGRRASDRERPPSGVRRPGGGGGGYRLPGRGFCSCRDGPQRVALRAGRDGRLKEAERRDRGEPRHPSDDGDPADFSERLPCRGGGDRSGDRPRGDRRLHGRRRLRHDPQSHARRGAGGRRPGAGPRPGAARADRPRSAKRPARHRHVQRLRHAARRRDAARRHARPSGLLPHQPARREGRRRGGDDRLARRHHERHRRCDPGRAGRRHADARDAREDLAGVQGPYNSRVEPRMMSSTGSTMWRGWRISMGVCSMS